MKKFIQSILSSLKTPPDIKPEERKYRVRTLLLLLYSSYASIFLYSFFAILAGQRFSDQLWAILLFIIIVAVVHYFLIKQRFYLASILYVTLLNLGVIYSGWRTGGILTPGFTALMLSIPITTILLGFSGGAFATVISIVSSIVLVYLEKQGLLPNYFWEDKLLSHLIAFNIYMITSLVIILISRQHLTQTLMTAFKELQYRKTIEEELTTKNDALEKVTQELEVLNVSKNNFIANMSHEIRTPLNNITGMVEIILNDTTQKFPQDLTEKFEVIQRNSQTLSILINDLLDLAKIEAGQISLIHEIVKLAEFIQQTISMIEHTAAEKGLIFSIQLTDKLPPYILIDPNRFRQILLNLLNNAIKFTKEGQIILSIDSHKEEAIEEKPQSESITLVCSVMDTGIGIAQDKSEEIFKPFVQLNKYERPRAIRGSGLGLPITKELVEKMGGKIWVESELGKGSKFIFTIQALIPTEN